MIITVTANPTLDKTLAVEELRIGKLNRARVVQEEFAGKGLLVSLALEALGIESRAIAFIGGRTGNALRLAFVEASFETDFIKVYGGETRTNITLVDEKTGTYTKINEPGPWVNEHDIAGLLTRASATEPDDIWVLSGSLPPGAPLNLYADMIRRVQGRGARAILDTSGAALREGAAARPFGIKLNTEEAAELLGGEITGDDGHAAAVRALMSRTGASIAAITRGADGLVLALTGTDRRVAVVKPPPVQAISPVASGDSALAGILWALLDQCGLEETARRAAAFGTATAMQSGSSIAPRDLVEELIDQMQVSFA